MKIDITHTTVTKKHTIFYVICNVTFTEEEKAIIRARSMEDTTVEFESGILNMRPEADTAIPAWLLDSGPKILLFFGILLVMFLASFGYNSFPGWVLIALGVFLWFARRSTSKAQVAAENTKLQLRDIIGKPFSLATASAPRIPEMEEEIRENMSVFKRLISETAEAPQAKSYEL